jgi:hypothetical protein
VTKTAESNTVKDTQSNKAAVHLPKFTGVRFSTPVTSSANAAVSVLKAANQSKGLVGAICSPSGSGTPTG